MRPRAASNDDYPAFVRLFPELRTGDDPPDAAAWARDLLPATLVAEAPEGVVGYLYGEATGATGYVRHVVVDPAVRGRGVGTVLMHAAAGRFREAGATRWCLNVRPDNTPALRLYRSLGMRRLYSAVSVRIGWGFAAEAAGLRAMPIPASDDRMVEIAARLPPGQLALARSRPGRVLTQLRDRRGAVVGVAVLDPGEACAFPFRVRSPEQAAALLGGLRCHADEASVTLVIEDDPTLAAYLLAAGGEERMRFVHLEGPLPGRDTPA
jgi:GNAT superfamily N-acetyltransferase